jgi:hypothetical protein
MLPIRAVSGGWRHRPADFLGKCCHVSIDRIDRRGFIRRWAATKFSPFAANSSCNVEQFPWQERRSRHGRLDQLAQATIIRMPACSRLRRFSMGLDGFGANACGMNLSFYRLKSAERSRRSASKPFDAHKCGGFILARPAGTRPGRPLHPASPRQPRLACGRGRAAADCARSRCRLIPPIQKCSAKPPSRQE